MICGDVNGREIQKKRGSVYTYSGFTLLYSGNKHDMVKQLYFNKNFLKKREVGRGLDWEFGLADANWCIKSG